MSRKFILLLLAMTPMGLCVQPAHANIGWTREQMEAKYGKPALTGGVSPSSVTWYLDKEKKNNFPHLLGEGFNAIRADFYEGKVCSLNLCRDSHAASLPTWQGNRAKYDAEYKKFEEEIKHRPYMPYEEAKVFAMSYIEANPDPRKIRNEKYRSGPNPNFPGGSEEPIGYFDYKGWHVIWKTDSLLILPIDGSGLARTIRARDDKYLEEADARRRTDAAATAHREAR